MKKVNTTWVVWVCEMIHGAGIGIHHKHQGTRARFSILDTDWSVARYPMGWICSSDWHAMDQDGRYVGYIPFLLIINRSGVLVKVNLDEKAIETVPGGNLDEFGESDAVEDYLYQTWSEYSDGLIVPSDEWSKAIKEDAFGSDTLHCPKVYSVKIK